MNMSIAAIYSNKIRESNARFKILTIAISVSGFSQGLLLPLLSVLLEKQGISSSFNGLSSSALYLGMLLASPLMEKPVRKFGFKPIILSGMLMVTIPMLFFPAWSNFYFWILLRFLVGVGDTALHYATQVWITSTVEAKKRGRSISLYGLSYGVGFGVGPLGLLLLKYSLWLPFLLAVVLFLIVITIILKLENEWPESTEETKGEKRYFKVYALAGIALMPMFIYGILESTLNTSFPIYGLRTGINEATVSTLLSSFVIGSLALQLPLGILSDKIGRKSVLILTTLFGGLLFGLVPYVNSSIQLYIIFILAGGLVGSLFSLGLAYVADLVPPSLLPTANIIASLHYGVGSIIGPYIGGSIIALISPSSLFFFIGVIILSFSIFASIGFVQGLMKREKSY